MFRHVAAAAFAVCSIPVCAGVALAAVRGTDELLGDTIPESCGKRGLVIGLLGMWGVVLFGFLLEQASWIADRIAPSDAENTTPAEPRPGANGGVARRENGGRGAPAISRVGPVGLVRSPEAAPQPGASHLVRDRGVDCDPSDLGGDAVNGPKGAAAGRRPGDNDRV